MQMHVLGIDHVDNCVEESCYHVAFVCKASPTLGLTMRRIYLGLLCLMVDFALIERERVFCLTTKDDHLIFASLHSG